MTIADQLERLRQLHAAGELSDAEYQQAKAAVLNESDSGSFGRSSYGRRSPESVGKSIGGFLSAKDWATVLHLSQFGGYVAPMLGFVAPILIWQLLKDEHPSLDRHGRIVMNWILSELIYAVAAFALAFALIGFALVPVVIVLGIVFPVIGALKANSGECWEYPLSIRFFSLDDCPISDHEASDVWH